MANTNFFGSVLNYTYYFPDLATQWDAPDSTVNILVGNHVEITDLYDFNDDAGDDSGNVHTVDVSANQIIVDFGSSSYWNTGAFNGFVLTDILDQIAPISSVTISQASFLNYFDPNNVTFTDDSIAVNWQGMSYDSNSVLVLDVTFAPPPLKPTSTIIASEGIVGFMSQLALASYKLVSNEIGGKYKYWGEQAFQSTDGSTSVWKHINPLTSVDLPNLDTSITNFGTNGIHNGIFTNENAAALVGRSSDSLFIAFRGTNDSTDRSHWTNKSDHFNLFQALINDIETYIISTLGSANPIKTIYLTGHSLGASMVEALMDYWPAGHFAGITIEAMAFSNMGYGPNSQTNSDPRITDFIVSGDLIHLGSLLEYNEGDQNVIYHNHGASASLHNMRLYSEFANFFVEEGLDIDSFGDLGLNGRNYDKIFAFFDKIKIVDPSTGKKVKDFKIGIQDDTIFGSRADDIILGGKGDDNLFGRAGDDHIVGGQDDDKLKGQSGDDFLYGKHGKDTLVGGKDNDLLDGGTEADTLKGGEGLDELYGQNGKDILRGGADNDVLVGGKGFDNLDGGKGLDHLYGGFGQDTFRFRKMSDINTPGDLSSSDIIHDFGAWGIRDTIDVSKIDAKSFKLGNQTFKFVGENGFTGKKGQLSYYKNAQDTFVVGDVNGDGVADFSIQIIGLHDFFASDFVL